MDQRPMDQRPTNRKPTNRNPMDQRPMDQRDVDAAVAEMLRVLGPHTVADWTVPAGTLSWSCRETAAHVAHDLLAYACQLTVRPDDAYLPLDLTVRPTASLAQVLQTVTACGGLLSAALATAEPEARAWHWGRTDPTGFAAMGVTETLVHTYDITSGLGLDWEPPADAAAAALARLFPDAPDAAGTPGQLLLWCTGRVALPGLPRQESWTWRSGVEGE